MISIIQAAEISDRLFRENRLKFYLESLIAIDEKISLLQLIRERIDTRLNPYAEYQIERTQQ